MNLSKDKLMNGLQPGKNRVYFMSEEYKLAGDIYLPRGFDAKKKYPTIVYTRPGSQVKEQTGAVYGRKLSDLGYVFFVFDPRNFGDSEGAVRNHESMHYMVPNTVDAISYLRMFDFVDREKFYGLGVCAGGTYISSVALGDSRIKKIATVGGNYDAARALFGAYPKDITDKMMALAAEGRQKYYETGEFDMLDIFAGMPFPPPENAPKTLKDTYEYYFERAGEEVCPNYSPKYPSVSLALDPARVFTVQAKYLSIPSLIIAGSQAFTKEIDKEVYELTGGPKKYFEIDGAGHMDLYDIDEYVDQAVAEIDLFFRTFE